MPPTLDLSRTAHTKIIVSPPRINLRRAASYNHDRGPLSSTSSRFNFNHLVFASPPPSPGLPSLSPPPRKSPRGLAGFVRPSRIIRFIIWLMSVIAVFYVTKYVLTLLFDGRTMRVPDWMAEYSGGQLAERGELLDTITPIVVSDKSGKPKWTVFVPGSSDSLPSGEQLRDICARCQKMPGRLQALGSRSRSQQGYLGFGSDVSDHDFVDVREARTAGYLPPSSPSEAQAVSTDKPVCEKSLTFVLDSFEAGLGETVMMLWTAYGLAKKEGRAFFIDDSHWAYGKYTDMFEPLPSAPCSPPTRQDMIPCPRQARHLIASPATASELFSPLHDEPPSDRSYRDSFALARAGHDALFRLTPDDASYVEQRTRELLARRIPPKTKGTITGLAVGLHIRRGDRHPLELQYSDSYIPLSKYLSAANTLISSKLGASLSRSSARDHSFLVLASDDPTIYSSTELESSSFDSVPAQDRIKLANHQHNKEHTAPDRKFMRKFIDENFGWEGGFFAGMFWNLGAPPGSPNRGPTAVPSAETLRLRSLMGRAYMMDLAVLADASDAVVCTASAAGCRVLAIMMGWEEAMEKKAWVNVDAAAGWMGV